MARKHPNEELCDMMVAEAEQRRSARKIITKSIIYDTKYSSDPVQLMQKIQSIQDEEISSNTRIVGIDIVSVMADGDGYRAFLQNARRTHRIEFLKS